jgi:hypothetical protein
MNSPLVSADTDYKLSTHVICAWLTAVARRLRCGKASPSPVSERVIPRTVAGLLVAVTTDFTDQRNMTATTAHAAPAATHTVEKSTPAHAS